MFGREHKEAPDDGIRLTPPSEGPSYCLESLIALQKALESGIPEESRFDQISQLDVRSMVRRAGVGVLEEACRN